MSAVGVRPCLQAFKGKKKGVTANSVNADAKWNTVAGDLFSALPSEGFGKEAGDFAIGQLVQVRDCAQITYRLIPEIGSRLHIGSSWRLGSSCMSRASMAALPSACKCSPRRLNFPTGRAQRWHMDLRQDYGLRPEW